MAYSDKLRSAVRSAYVYERMDVKGLAKKYKVPENTIHSWRARARLAGDDWDKARSAASVAGDGAQAVAMRFMEDFMHLLDGTMAAIKADQKMKPQEKVDALARLSDAYNKAMAAVKRTVPELAPLAVAMEVLQLQAKFVQGHFPQHARAFTEILEPFGEELAKHYG